MTREDYGACRCYHGYTVSVGPLAVGRLTAVSAEGSCEGVLWREEMEKTRSPLDCNGQFDVREIFVRGDRVLRTYEHLLVVNSWQSDGGFIRFSGSFVRERAEPRVFSLLDFPPLKTPAP